LAVSFGYVHHWFPSLTEYRGAAAWRQAVAKIYGEGEGGAEGGAGAATSAVESGSVAAAACSPAALAALSVALAQVLRLG